MTPVTEPGELEAIAREIVARSLAEDLGPGGDVTSVALVPEMVGGRGRIVARAFGVQAGRVPATEAFRQVDPAVKVEWHHIDGDTVWRDSVLATLEGPYRSILTAERIALNLLCHLSGVASLTRRYVEACGPRTTVLDTRKTTPGLRFLEKAAVVAGGGTNHRAGLSDAVLVKDNHLALVKIADAVARARQAWPDRLVEVECDTLDQVVEGRDAGADRLLLDNMTPEQVAEAVQLLAGAVPVEVSGGLDLDNVAAYAAAGADFVSVGALTHSAPALDLSLEVEPVGEG